MASQQGVPTAPRPPSVVSPMSPPPTLTETVIMPSGAPMNLGVPGRLSPLPVDGCVDPGKPENGASDIASITNIAGFLSR